MNKHFDLLGYKAKDKITGFKGVISSLSFDLYGCIQAVIQPECDKNSIKIEDGRWFDVTRIEILSKKRVMNIPDYTKGYISEGFKGCAEKPNK